MRLKDLITVYFYSPIDDKVDGEITKSWVYKNKYKLNSQQDINELDKNSSGDIDYETIKFRTDKSIDIEKNDGVSFELLEDGAIPPYRVSSHTVIGRTHLITCKTYYGE